MHPPPLMHENLTPSLDPENNAIWTDRVGMMSECLPDFRRNSSQDALPESTSDFLSVSIIAEPLKTLERYSEAD